MWQSVLRIVFALLITAVGASLLIGTVSAEGPVPEQPSGSELGPIDERPTKDDPLTGIAETIVTNVFQTTFGQLTAAQQAQFDVPLANSASVTC